MILGGVLEQRRAGGENRGGGGRGDWSYGMDG